MANGVEKWLEEEAEKFMSEHKTERVGHMQGTPLTEALSKKALLGAIVVISRQHKREKDAGEKLHVFEAEMNELRRKVFG